MSKKTDESFSMLSAYYSAAAGVGKKSGDCGCGCNELDAKDGNTFTGSPFLRISSVVAAQVRTPLAHNTNAVNLKVLASMQARGEKVRFGDVSEYMVDLPIATKAGSRDGTGRRVGRAVVSLIVPGDSSDIRSPVRSAIYEALTPGGGKNRGRRGLLGRIGGDSARRCPAGFENGGRFANSALSNCGAMLFRSVINGLEGGRGGIGGGIGAPSGISGRRVGAGPYGDSPISSRDANVPPIGKPSSKKRQETIDKEIRAASWANGLQMRMVRADGFVMEPVSSIQRIAKQRNNKDIINAAWITTLNSPKNIGGDEILLLGAGVTRIDYAVPGSGSISLSTLKPITPSRASALKRAVETARRSEGDEGGMALREMVRLSKGDVSYSESFPGIDKPNELVVVKRGNETKTVPRWIYESWMSSEAQGKKKGEGSWSIVDVVVSPDGSGEAVDSSAKITATAESLSSTDSFRRGDVLAKGKSSDWGNDRKLFQMNDGTRWVETQTTGVEHLGFVVGNDIANALGVSAPTSHISGKADARRPVVQMTEDFPDGRVNKNIALKDVPGEDLARVILLDYITDNRGRTPATLLPLKGKGTDVVSFSNSKNLLASGGSVKTLDFQSYLKQDGSSEWILEAIAEQEQIKKKLAEMYEQMIENSRKFDWDAYRARLSGSGLTSAEKNHLEIIEKLYRSRTETMIQSRKSFLATLGVTL